MTDEDADLIGWESSEQVRVVGAKGEHEEFNPFELEFGDDGFTGVLAKRRRQSNRRFVHVLAGPAAQARVLVRGWRVLVVARRVDAMVVIAEAPRVASELGSVGGEPDMEPDSLRSWLSATTRRLVVGVCHITLRVSR